jgi:hypothetical protein
MELTKRMSSYLPVLIKTVLETKGPILEMGAGPFSTPVLHWLCSKNRRTLVTCENNSESYAFAKQFQSRNHKIVLVKDWDEVTAGDTHWSVVLIDHAPEFRRPVEAIKFKNNADYIVLHDTEEKNEHIYNYNSVWSHFRYRYDYDFCSPRTTVVSNFKDPVKIF